MKNVYDTSNPEKLLLLKRQEADALRDVIRSINRKNLTPEHIFKIAQNTLLAQLRVRKMLFLYQDEEEIKTGIMFNYEPLTREAMGELPQKVSVEEIKADSHPALFQTGGEFVLSFLFREKVAAWFIISEFAESDAEKESDLIFMEIMGNVMTTALENRWLISELVQQEAVKREMEVAGRIQQQLLSDDFSEIQGAEIDAWNKPHFKIGGDFYDVIPRGNLGFFVCIADVSGKGMGAALLMANLQAQLRAHILSQNSLEGVINKLHQGLISITQGEKFVTLFLAHVKLKEKQIDYINAGHNPPYLITREGLTPLTTGTIPLGILDLPSVQHGEVDYQEGDVLFLFTDGLVDQENKDGELLGEEVVEEMLPAFHNTDPSTVVEGVRNFCEEFGDGQSSSDDITLLALKLTN